MPRLGGRPRLKRDGEREWDGRGKDGGQKGTEKERTLRLNGPWDTQMIHCVELPICVYSHGPVRRECLGARVFEYKRA
eukprot:4594948-Pyramimonas_sp.AAC.1